MNLIFILKTTKYFLITILSVLVLIILINFVFERTYSQADNLKFGVSFSPRYARYLNLDWQKVYIQMLDELKVKNLRLPGYWTSLEPGKGNYDFSETDFMLSEAEKRGVRVILVVGLRQPRWPECHIPSWAKGLSIKDRQDNVLEFVQKVVERYKQNRAIWAYQVENEPFVSWFGENCDPPDKRFLEREIQLVKKLDNSRSVVVTDSGEWSSWNGAMTSSDVLGVSLYRRAYNPLFGNITYPVPGFIYPLKSNVIRKVLAPFNQKTIITELQAEPWVQKAIPDTSLEEQMKLFSIDNFKSNLDYAKKTGFDEIYLWGVEWWYYIAGKGHTEYLDFAKTIFQ